MAPRVTGNSSSGRRVSPTIRALAMMVTATLAQSALTKDLAPIDRWADARPAARAHAPVIGAGLLSEFRGHVDDRLGVPTFLWAGPDASRSPMSPTVGTPEGIARVLYCTMAGRRIVVLHSFIKKTDKIPAKDLNLARNRLKELKK